MYDVIEVLPINFGIHLACFAYNWLDDFSEEDNKEFTDDSRVVFNGGQVDASGMFNGSPEIYEITNINKFISVLDNLCKMFGNTTIPKLEEIKTKKEFISSVDEIHEYSLKAFGLI